MDIVSHGLYGGASFFNKSKRSFWTAVWWGVFPDLFAFGTFFPFYVWEHGFPPVVGRTPSPELIPSYIHMLYNFSHSLVVFITIFAVVWWWRDRPLYELLPWALHILMDIPTHNNHFFPTPFLYPISSYYINGISWGTKWFFISYWIILIAIYVYLFQKRKKQSVAGEVIT